MLVKVATKLAVMVVVVTLCKKNVGGTGGNATAAVMVHKCWWLWWLWWVQRERRRLTVAKDEAVMKWS
jgi:hypothetical protein